MFSQKLIGGSLALALTLSTGSAFAEQSERGGYRNAVVVTEHAQEKASGASYRDSATRLETRDGSVASASKGYRDRFASSPSRGTPRRTAAR